MNAAQLLENSLQADAGVREAATKQLEAAARDNFHGYLHTLASELANESTAPHIRRAAGLAFKNSLAARDTVNQAALTERYLALPESATAPLKQSLLSTLGSSQHAAGAVAAQCVSAVAAVELPANRWPELIGLLLEFVQNQDNVGLRINTLQAVGYVCEVISPDLLSARSNEILTAVVQGARKEETSMEVQSAAIHALYNSLEFISDNFDREGERNYIMQVVCEATQSPSSAVQVGAFECLVRIMGLYYEKMEFYVERALFGLTVMGMKHNDEPVVLQAIEFWSTVCEEEIEFAIEAQEAAAYGEEPVVEPKGFAKMALQEVLPVLLGLLSQQEEDEDEDEWTKSMAAASCLELFAKNVGDAIVQPVVPFVEAGIQRQEWQLREAAVMAFGSILDGPEPTTLSPLVTQAIGALIGMMSSDPSMQVRDTVAWTLSRIVDIMLDTINPNAHLDNLISALVLGLQASPRIVNSCCSALGSLVTQFSAAGQLDGMAEQSRMSQYYQGILQALMPITERPTNENNARSAAYQTICIYVAGATKDVEPIVQDIFLAFIARQEALLGMHAQLVGMDDKNNWNDMEVNICAVLQSVIHRSPSMVAPHADRIMTNLLQIIQFSGKHSGVLEDVFATVGALASAQESAFQKYLEAFAPFLFSGLQSFEDWQVGQSAVYVVMDIARAVQGGLAQYSQQIMIHLVDILRNPVINRDVKPNSITAIGEIALAIGDAFIPFLQTTMEILSQAGSTAAQANDVAMIEFVWTMRECIVEAFISILNGLKHNPAPFRPYVGGIMGFLQNCSADEERTDAFSTSLLGLIGDFADIYKRDVRNELLQEWVQQAIQYGRQRGSSKSARSNAGYAAKAIKSLG